MKFKIMAICSFKHLYLHLKMIIPRSNCSLSFTMILLLKIIKHFALYNKLFFEDLLGNYYTKEFVSSSLLQFNTSTYGMNL